jgi:uncharacterized phage protein (TIGR01671 family)
MRKIKFRAWHRCPEGEWDEKADDWAYKMDYDICFEDCEPINDLLSGVENLMLFTGLKDINNCEIYESDILAEYNILDDKKIDEKFIVSWKKAYSGFQWCTTRLDGKLSDFYGGILNDNLNVIGNIYENPELLKEIKK